MDDATLSKVQATFRATCERHGVRYLTALMTMTALEAIVPMATEGAKSMIIHQLEGLRGCVGETEFIAMVRFAKSSCWTTNEDICAACDAEILRQSRSGTSVRDVNVLPSLSINDDLRQELVARERLIAEQQQQITDLSMQLATRQDGAATARERTLEERCRRAEMEASLAKRRLQSGATPGRWATIVAQQPAVAGAVSSPARFASAAGIQQTPARGSSIYGAPPPQTPAGRLFFESPVQLSAHRPPSSPTVPYSLSPPPPPLASAVVGVTGQQLARPRLVGDAMSPMAAWITTTHVSDFRQSATGAYSPTPAVQNAKEAAPVAAAGSRLGSIYHVIGLEKQATRDSFVLSRWA
jgi:hypothetical protein